MIAWSSAARISAPFSALDHADPSSPQRIAEEIDRRGIQVDLLVNNAGFGLSGEFLPMIPGRNKLEEAVWAARMEGERSVLSCVSPQ